MGAGTCSGLKEEQRKSMFKRSKDFRYDQEPIAKKKPAETPDFADPED